LWQNNTCIKKFIEKRKNRPEVMKWNVAKKFWLKRGAVFAD